MYQNHQSPQGSRVPGGGSSRGGPRRLARGVAITTLVAVGITLAACSGGSATPTTTGVVPSGSTATTSSGSPRGSATSTIEIKNFAFSPMDITVAPGATVTVTNQDQVTHTLTATTGGFNTGNIAPGQSKTFTAPNAPGRYPYICNIHQYMTGTVTVS